MTISVNISDIIDILIFSVRLHDEVVQALQCHISKTHAAVMRQRGTI